MREMDSARLLFLRQESLYKGSVFLSHNECAFNEAERCPQFLELPKINVNKENKVSLRLRLLKAVFPNMKYIYFVSR